MNVNSLTKVFLLEVIMVLSQIYVYNTACNVEAE